MNKRELYHNIRFIIRKSSRSRTDRVTSSQTYLVNDGGLNSSGQHLDQLVSLDGIFNNQSDQITRSAGLEFDVFGVLLNDDGAGVLAANELEEFLNIGNLLRL